MDDVEARTRGWLLWTRSTLLASVAVLLGVVAHVHAGGMLPDAGWLVGLVALATVAVAPALREEATAPVLAALLVLGQTGVHLGLMAAVPHHAGSGSHGSLMLVAHAAAALACGWWLAHGERALWTLLALVLGAGRALLLLLLADAVVPHRLAPVASWTEPTTREQQGHWRCRPRRGPPRPTA